MVKPSKVHIKLLMFTLVIMLALSLTVNLFMSKTAFGGIGSMRSGEFVNTSQGINAYGWYFYADEANGNSSFFANLSQSDLDNLTLTSKVSAGEVKLVITQESVILTYALNSEKLPNSIGNDMLNPGRVDMRLYFTFAENVSVSVNWR